MPESNQSTAADPGVVRYLRREDGVPSSQVQQLAFDQAGRLWMATPSGLASYDGARVASYARRQGLRSHGLRTVACGPNGQLWVGSDAGYEILDDGTVLTSHAASTGWPFGFVDCIQFAGGDVLLGTASGLVTLEGAAQRPELIADAGASPVRDLCCSADGRLWAIAGTTLLTRIHGRWVTQVLGPDGESARPTAIAPAAADGIVVGTSAGFVEVAGNGALRRPRAGNRPVGAVRCLEVIGNALWAAVDDELCVYHRLKGQWQFDHVALSGRLVNDLLPDRFGNVWAATEGHGVARFSALRNAIRRLPQHSPQAIFSIRGTPDGRLLVGGESATCYRCPDRPEAGDDVPALAGRQVWDILQRADGRLLAATAGGLLLVDGDGNARKLGTDSAVLSQPARCIAEHGGKTYVGGIGGCVAVEPDFSIADVPTVGGDLGYVYTLQTDSLGRLWAGTIGNGLWQLADDRFERFRNELLSTAGNTYAIDTRADGTVVFVQDDCIYVLDTDGRLRRLAQTDDAIAGWTLRCAPDDTVWSGSASGLVQYDLGTGRRLRQITAMLGLSNWEFTTSRSLFLHDDGRYFCGVNAGLVVVDTRAIAALPELPEVSLAAMRWERVEPHRQGDRYLVPYSRWTLALQIFVPWYIDEGDVQYRFRLTGFDEDWRGLQGESLIRLNTLPPGDYELEAQAWNRMVGFGPSAILLRLRVERPRLLARLIKSPFAGIAEMRNIGRAVERNRSLNRKNIELQQLVEERTADLEKAKRRLEDMNRELANQSVTDPLTGVGNRRMFDKQLEAAVIEARRSGKTLSLLLLDIDYFKPFNDIYGHSRGDEALVMVARSLLATLFRPGDQIARYGGEEFAVLLPDVTHEGAIAVAERLRSTVFDLGIGHRGAPETGKVTISVGVTSWNPLATTVAPGTGKQLIESADAALYDAKQFGRNNTQFRPLTATI